MKTNNSNTPRNGQLEKWGDAGRAGFQVVPNVLFRAQKRLEIDSMDVVILLNLSLHWWGGANLPFPSPATIANRMDVSRRTVERRLEALERRNFIKRLKPEVPQAGKPKVRKFELRGLVEKLESCAAVNITQRNFKQAHQPRHLAD
jgi:hypothetical protein